MGWQHSSLLQGMCMLGTISLFLFMFLVGLAPRQSWTGGSSRGELLSSLFLMGLYQDEAFYTVPGYE